MERLASLNTTFITILQKEKQLHVSALRPSSGWILGLKENILLHRLFEELIYYDGGGGWNEISFLQ
jgi:hypothetical protein